MAHRIRHAMQDISNDPLSGTVEVDETCIGGKETNKRKSKRGLSAPVLSATTELLGAVRQAAEREDLASNNSALLH
jgi:hypothetical protein